ncbi:hypothetical protein [Actinoplanes subglobosus]|uniref:Uncharacterized protein n=1 Tax=Actinoplanes subglobosus TaxID=1547892 RepID=A0ABV8IYY0_9ACTN
MPADDVPLAVGDAFAVVGPVGGRGLTHRELVRRVNTWGSPAAPAPPAAVPDLRETADWCAQAPPGSAALVHRVTGEVDRLSGLGPGRTRWSGIRTLPEVSARRLGRDDDLHHLFHPWTGPLRKPVIGPAVRGVTVASCLVRATPAGADAIGWASRSSGSVRHAVLEGLRLLASAGFPGSGPAGVECAGAAGVSESHWLIDGTLALLTRHARSLGPVPAPDLGEPAVAVLHAVPGLPGAWRFAEVVATGSGVRLAAAWGRDGAEAIDHAVGVPRCAAGTASRPAADPMLRGLSAGERENLVGDLLRYGDRLGVRTMGVRVAADALQGAQPVAWGPVWFRRT